MFQRKGLPESTEVPQNFFSSKLDRFLKPAFWFILCRPDWQVWNELLKLIGNYCIDLMKHLTGPRWCYSKAYFIEAVIMQLLWDVWVVRKPIRCKQALFRNGLKLDSSVTIRENEICLDCNLLLCVSCLGCNQCGGRWTRRTGWTGSTISDIWLQLQTFKWRLTCNVTVNL